MKYWDMPVFRIHKSNWLVPWKDLFRQMVVVLTKVLLFPPPYYLLNNIRLIWRYWVPNFGSSNDLSIQDWFILLGVLPCNWLCFCPHPVLPDCSDCPNCSIIKFCIIKIHILLFWLFVVVVNMHYRKIVCNLVHNWLEQHFYMCR